MDKDELLKRYLKTIKGRHIIATSIELPIRLCQIVYKEGKIHYRIDGKLYNTEEAEVWKQKVREQHRIDCMKKYFLTEDDFQLSEEKLNQIEFDESIGKIRNVGLIDAGNSESDDLKDSILDRVRPKLRDLHEFKK